MILLPLMIIWARRPMYFTNFSRWILVAIAFVALCCLGPYQSQFAKVHAEENLPNASEKHREGTRVTALVGFFESAGRRWTFTSESGELAFAVLENLSLERVAKAIEEDPEDRHWKISGELTEYFDQNYLLIDRLERAAKGVEE